MARPPRFQRAGGRHQDHPSLAGRHRRDVENQIARFRREMRLCAELSHPNIVRLIDSGESEDGMLYAVFAYVPGATLREVLATEGPLGWELARHLMTQVLDALACAHTRGVVHRDLKPENIMVTQTRGAAERLGARLRSRGAHAGGERLVLAVAHGDAGDPGYPFLFRP
jgi:serine/threonine protein kinase